MKNCNAEIGDSIFLACGKKKEIEKKILKTQQEISEIKKNSISSINDISGSIASDIIENISGDKLNEDSVKAAVEDISKKNINKYL